MTPVTNKRYFAVGLSKEWVEIRSSPRTPTKHSSKAERLIEVAQTIYDVRDDFWGYPRRVPKKTKVTKKLVIEATNYIGGKVVKVMKADAFTRKFKVRVMKGGLVEMTPVMIKKLKLEIE